MRLVARAALRLIQAPTQFPAYPHWIGWRRMCLDPLLLPLADLLFRRLCHVLFTKQKTRCCCNSAPRTARKGEPECILPVYS